VPAATPFWSSTEYLLSIGGKWLMGAVLHIPLTLLGRGKGAVGGEIIPMNCCKRLQISRPFFQALLTPAPVGPTVIDTVRA